MNDYRKQTRSAFLRAIRKAFVLSRESEKQGIPLAEIIQQAAEKGASFPRRAFLANAAKAGLVIGLGGITPACRKAVDQDAQAPGRKEPTLLGSSKTQPSIAIIGAGIAGLNCAYQLKKQGIYNDAPNLLDLENGDLKYKVDFREVYGTILDKWLDVNNQQILSKRFQTMDFI